MIEAARRIIAQSSATQTLMNRESRRSLMDLKHLYALFFDENAFGHQKGEGDEFKKCTLV